MRFEKLEGIFYLLFSCALFLPSVVFIIHHLAQHAWSSLLLPIFFVFLAVTLACYAASRWLYVRQKKTYTKIYRDYLLVQLGTFSYLVAVGIYFSIHHMHLLATVSIGIGSIASLFSLIALYFLKKDMKQTTAYYPNR